MKNVLVLCGFFLFVTSLYSQGVVRTRPGTQGVNDFWIDDVFNQKLVTTTPSDTLVFVSKTIPLLGTVLLQDDSTHGTPVVFENNTGDTLRVKINFTSVSQNGFPYSVAPGTGLPIWAGKTSMPGSSFVTVPPRTAISSFVFHIMRTHFERITVTLITDNGAGNVKNNGYWRLYKVKF